MTTSTHAAQAIAEHLRSVIAAREVGIGDRTVRTVEVLEPAPANAGWAHAALVVTLSTGERFGMEVVPFPVLPGSRLGGVESWT